MGNWELSCNQHLLQADGACIRVSIGHSTLEYQEASSIGLELPPPLIVTALIDTGAALTVVNPTIARNCKLRHTGFKLISAVGHHDKYPEYAAALSFPETNLSPFDVVRIVASDLFMQEYSCLIGRDISYNGPTGQVTVQD